MSLASKAKDTHHAPPTTELHSRNFLKVAIVWIRADEKEQKGRQTLRTRTGPETCYGPSSNIRFALDGIADRKQHPLIRIGSLLTG
jgi:hypothetical protein